MPAIQKIGLAFAFSLGFEITSSAQTFTEVAQPLPGVRSGSVSWGDFDNDGDLDLLLTGNTGATTITRIYRNNGNNPFTDLNAGLPGVAEGAAVWGDYNGDGLLDLALTGQGTAGRISRIYRNNGNATFTDLNLGLPGLEAATVAWGDYDNDGDLDLFLTGYTGSTYVGAIYRNNGTNSFSDSGITTIKGGASGSAAWSDFDKDGDLDLLFSGFTLDTTSGQSSRLYRNHNGSFTNLTSFNFTALSKASVAWGDYDNDGHLDLLMAGSSVTSGQSTPTLRLYRNSGGTNFSVVPTAMSGAQNCSLAWGDFDNDGDLDVAIAGYNPSFQPTAKIYRNDGGNIFTDSGTSLTGVYDAALAWNDYDLDGDLDLILTGYTGSTNTTRLYRNNSGSANLPPNQPAVSGATISTKTATLAWLDNGDGNQSGGLTYNLRVSTTPGANQILSAMADSGSGFRRVVRLGNVNQRTNWTLNLPVGNYYWAVQAVDHAYAGSAFSGEQIFTVPAQAPNAATLFATNITIAGVTLRGTANPNGAATVGYFEYGLTTNYGAATPPQALGSGGSELTASAELNSLLPATGYMFRMVASNSFGVSYGTNLSFTTPTFVEVTNSTFLGMSGAIAWGDYDNDGDLDLLVAGGNSTGAVTWVYRNDPGPTFVAVAAPLPNVGGGTVMWGDYDNDTDLDILLTGSLTRIYRNDGGNIFTDINAGLPALGTGGSAQWADFDNDGDLDFVMSAGGSNSARLDRNDGNDRFTNITNGLPTLFDCALAWADYDNDGDQDLLLTGYNSGVASEITRLYGNDGHGNFTNSNLNFQSVDRSSAAWGDYDNDGDLDLLLTGSRGATRYSLIYSNQGVGTFASQPIPAAPKTDLGNVAWGDYDNDGDLDFLQTGLTSTGSVMRVMRNDANIFRDSGAMLPSLSSSRAEWGDYDNDGRLDILLAGHDGTNYVTKLFRNVSLNLNTPPAAPAGLVATVTNNAASLNWNPSPDANQAGGLSYNLRLGTAPGLADVSSPMADSATGFRRVPRLGDANLRRSRTLTNLVVGTYYWGVQAVDHNYAGSGFSTNGSFTITTALLPPNAITKPATNLSLFTATVTGSANPKGAPTMTFFQYGTTTNLGNITPAVNIGAGTTNFPVIAALSGLSDGTTYFFRLGASNVNGLVFGDTRSFTTDSQFSNVVTALPFLSKGNYDWNGCAVWGDYDNDGDLDVAVTAVNLLTTEIYRNDGSNVFTLANTNLPPSRFVGTLEWGDYDHDGDMDLLISNAAENMTVMRNDGGGNFTAAAALRTADFATWVDYDNDGDLDISSYDSAYPTSTQARLYRNEGGVFVESGVAMPRLTAGSMAWGDYDGDGDSDLAVSGLISITNYLVPTTRIYRNDLHGDFTATQVPLVGLEDSHIAWGDYDNDNDLDLLCVGRNASGYQSILYRNDNGNFVDANLGLPPAIGVGPAGWADYDNDGDLDLYLNYQGYYYSTNRLFRNDGGAFTDSGKYFVSSPSWYVNISSAAWGDYDQDGDLDALIGSQLFRNNNLIANALPPAPIGLSQTRTGNVVTLQWNVPADADQSGGLTYNLQVGTTPGGHDVVTPAAALTGRRRVARPGFATQPFWKLDLPVGTYYWRVQAIDHTLAGSAFSSEQSFVVPVQSPGVLTRDITTNSLAQLVMNATVNPNGAATVTYFQVGPTTSYGITSAPQLPGSGTATLAISNLVFAYQPGVPYHYRVVASNSFGISFGADRVITPPPFVELTGNLAVTQEPLAFGDCDNDGDLDLVSNGSIIWNQFPVLTNRVNFSMASSPYGPPALGDYDGDGDLDVLSGGSALILNRNNNGVFSGTNLLSTGASYAAAAWVDFDNDGDLDIFYPTWTISRFLRNDGKDVFVGLATNIFPAFMFPVMDWGDYDTDGDMDLVIAGESGTNRVTCIYRNDGNGAFTDLNAGLPGLETGSVAWGDYDNDGDLDLLITGTKILDGTSADYLACLYRNDNGLFVDRQLGLPGTTQGGAVWADYDADGRLDFVLTGVTNRYVPDGLITRLYHNDGNGNFSIAADLSGTAGFPRWGDCDNDGRPDLLIGGMGSFPRLFHNNQPATNSPPNSPTDLTGVATNGVILLHWHAAADADQADGLSYNVRIGTSPGGENLFSSMANRTNGWRRVSQWGNAGERLSWSLTNTQLGGTYYWSVQAIDHAFAGSTFAPEASFSLPPIAPAGQTGTVTNLATSSAEVTGSVFPGGVATTFFVEYGPSTNYGFQSSTQLVGPEARWHLVSAPLTNLAIGRLYHYRLVCFNSVGTNYAADATFITLQFSAVTNVAVTWGASSVAWGDYDNDGRLDFALAFADYSYPVRLYHNDGDGLFRDTGATFPAASWGDAKWADYDNDGDLDLATLGGNGLTYYTLNIFRNHGGGSFTLAATPLSGYSMGGGVGGGGTLDWGDYDNDGDLDLLAVAGSSSPFAKVFRNNGNNQFVDVSAPLPAINSGSGTWGDFDQDSDLDILVAGYFPTGSTNITRLYTNHGNGTFSQSMAHYFQGVAGGSAQFADLDNDNDLDILICGVTNNQSYSPPVTRLYRNAGGVFFENATSLRGFRYGRPAIGDYDNDGRPDLFFQDQGFSRLYGNEGGLVFTDTGLMVATNQNVPIVWADFDADGRLDYLETQYLNWTNQAFLYRNFNLTTNPTPATPPALSATVSGTSAILSWQHATDANQSGGWSYNLRVGTTPGGSEIVAPMADATTGQRSVVRMGNMQNNTQGTLRNLPAGRYYWSVQTVDHSFAGSPFAPEQSFLRNLQPGANPQLIVMAEDTLRPITLTATDTDGQPLAYFVTATPTNGALMGTPPSVSYRPKTNFFGADRLEFQVYDGFTNSAPVTISLIVTQVLDVPFSTLTIAPISNGLPRLTLHGEPYEHYRLEASTNLANWITVTNLDSPDGLMQIMLADAASYPHRFYRAALTDPPAPITAPHLATNGLFQMNFAGQLARSYEIQASTNLTAWATLTNLLVVASPATFTDQGSTNYPWRFYRIRLAR